MNRLLLLAACAAPVMLGACEAFRAPPVPYSHVNDAPPRAIDHGGASSSPTPAASPVLREQVPTARVAPQTPLPLSPAASASNVCADFYAEHTSPQGGWYPMFAKKANMTLQEFVAELGAKSSKLRVQGPGYLQEFQCLGAPVGNSVASMQAFLLSGAVRVEPCTRAALARYDMGRSDASGLIRDHRHHRSICYTGEQFVVEKATGRLLLSLGCGNTLVSRDKLVPSTPGRSDTPPKIICPAC